MSNRDKPNANGTTGKDIPERVQENGHELQENQASIGGRHDQVPVDFPRPAYQSPLSGAQPKLALVEYNGKFYYPGATPPEICRRWDVCEDLAQQFSRKCLESKAGKRDNMSCEAIVEQYLERLLKTRWVSRPEASWVMRRAAQLIGWPLPDSLKNEQGST